MMKLRAAVLVLAACFVWSAVQAEHSGLLVTFPKTLLHNTVEKVCFTTHGLVGETSVVLNATYPNTQCRSERVAWTGTEQDVCMEISIKCVETEGSLSSILNFYGIRRPPPPSPARAHLHLQVEGETSAGQSITRRYEKDVNIVAEKMQTFIQTDKPIYQPGQKVMFRVLIVKYPDMIPDIGNVKRVWITSPGGTRMQQWRNPVSTDGLLDVDFALATEPELGKWTIHVRVNNVFTIQSFVVKEYVLPKFEVLISPPSYLFMGHEGDIPIRVCAKYTYGQPVQGRVTANITVANPEGTVSHWSRVRRVIPIEMNANDATGCADITVPASLLDLNHYSFSSYKQKLIIKANFKERGTDVTMGAVSTSCPLTSEAIKLEIRGPSVFKPGLPYRGEVVVTKPDGSAAPAHNVTVTLDRASGRVVETRANGVGAFELTMPFDPSVTSLNIRASFHPSSAAQYESIRPRPSYRRVIRLPTGAKSLRAWYSPSASFLDIEPIGQKVAVGQSVPIQLEFTVPESDTVSQIEFFHRMVSRGRITSNGQLTWRNTSVVGLGEGLLLEIRIHPLPQQELVASRMSASGRSHLRVRRQWHRFYHHRTSTTTAPVFTPYPSVGRGQLQFHINAIASMSPISRLIVYYIRSDGEVVSASTEISMAPAFEHQVSVDFLEGREVRPGHPASVAITARPFSLCAVGVVDKSVHIMGGDNQLTKAKVFEPVASLNEVGGETSDKCPSQASTTDVVTSSRHADSLEGFRTAGLGVVTDLDLETRPCWIRTYRNYDPCSGWRCEVMFAQPVAMEIAPRPIARHGIDFSQGVSDVQRTASSLDRVAEEIPGPLVELRNYFPETWLWKLTRVGPDGRHVTREDIPHTITDWVASAFCLSSDHGVGVADSTSIRAFQPFFLSYTLPYSVIRGEKVPVKVTVFNYLTNCLNIQLSMTESDDFLIDARPTSETIEVCGNSAQTLEYEIVPVELGDIAIRTSASAVLSAERGDIPIDGTTFPVTDAIEDTVLVEPEGAEREETFSELICPADEEDGLYWSSVPLALPSLVVPGSARGRIQVIGDVMGPVMSNLDGLLRMPYGCGEQNMIFMAPNIYVMQYLSLTNQLTSTLQEKARKFMSSGYQRELTYGLSDGSYSAFGERDGEGSTWLTAFVLKCFAQAQDFMEIDERNLAKTRRWLAGNERDANGCVIKRGRVIHKEMQGAVSSPVTMTAFVTVSLLEAGASPQDPSVVLGLECLKNWLETTEQDSMDTYSLAISGYALGLGEYYTSQSDALFYLDDKAVGEANSYHWSNSDDTETEDTVCVHHCRAASSDVEVTAYALLAYLHQDLGFDSILSETMPVVKWLSSQRNALGGFSSTQDTVLGLQALSQFAELVYDPNSPMSLNISVNATRAPPSGYQEYDFEITDSNRLVLQREELAEVPTELAVTARGTGCALFQAELRYNVPVLSPNRLLFNISVTIDDWLGNSVSDPAACGDKTMNICVRYTGSGYETNMAVMEVKMVSGYIPHEDSLEEFFSRHAGRLGLKRIDKYEKGKPLALYFDQFDDTTRCVRINLKQQFIVKEAKGAVIKVYDYYKPGVVGFKGYNTCEVEL